MKKLINFLRSTVFNKDWWEWNKDKVASALLIISAVLGATIVTIIGCITTNTTKATAEADYASLYNQLESIKEDFDSIYNMDNIQMNIKNNILITIKSENCNLEVSFDKNRKYITGTDKKVDNFMSIVAVIIAGIISGAILGVCGLLVCLFVGVGIGWLKDKIEKLLVKKDNKEEEKEE